MSFGRAVCCSLVGIVCLSLSVAGAQPPSGKGPTTTDELPRPRPVSSAPLAEADSILPRQATPIDLASALRLAGVQNPEILLARERALEAVALRQLAAAQLLPTINAGTSYDTHTGPLQQATGGIIQVNRGSLYAGLGASAVGAGTVNIPGLVLSGNVSDMLFANLVARQVVRQRDFASQAVRNDVLRRVALAYLELLRAEGHHAVALQNRAEARELARILAGFAKAGEERPADADRAATDFEQRNADVLEAENDTLAASARLAQLLELDPSVRLHAGDGWVVPASIVPDPVPLPELIAIALTQRPELKEQQAAIRAALLALQGAKVLPFSPTVVLGYSVGTFGGGSSLASAGIVQPDGSVLQQPRFDSFAGRQDFDAIVYWSLRNLGVGNVALVKLARSNLRASDLRRIEVLDRVRAEVASAYAATHARFGQIDTREKAVRYSQGGFEKDFKRARGGVGLPIEVVDSLRLLSRSRTAYLDAIVDYNRAQVELYVALGQPPADVLARPIPATLVSAPRQPAQPTPSK
jgi:outer membrane protein TolC